MIKVFTSFLIIIVVNITILGEETNLIDLRNFINNSLKNNTEFQQILIDELF